MAAVYLQGVYLGSSDMVLSQTTYNQLLTDPRFNPTDTAPFLAANSNYVFRAPFPDELGTAIGNYGTENDLRGVLYKVPSSVFQLPSHVTVQAQYLKTGEIFDTDCPYLSPAPEDEIEFEIVHQEFVDDGGTNKLSCRVRCYACGTYYTMTEAEFQAVYDYLYPQGTTMQKEQLALLSDETGEDVQFKLDLLDEMLAGYSYNG